MCPSGFCLFLSMRRYYNIYAENYIWLWLLAASRLTQMLFSSLWLIAASTGCQSATFVTCPRVQSTKENEKQSKSWSFALRHSQYMGPVRTSTRDVYIMLKTCHRSLQSRSSRTSQRQNSQIGLSPSSPRSHFLFSSLISKCFTQSTNTCQMPPVYNTLG